MDKVIKLSNVEIPLSLYRARVIYANKYSEAYGGAFNFPVSSTLYTDVVFRLNENNEDIKTYIKNLDLPIYTEQDVIVICSGKRVLGYVDMQTNYYYYTTNDFSRKLGVGFSLLWVFLIGILGGVCFYYINNRQGSLWLFVPFIASWVVYLIQKMILNYRVKKEIDNILR